MRELDVRKTQFTVADFLSWQREGSLNLKPRFQRRSVWKPGARSYFLDTVVRGLPAPIIYLRQRVDLTTQTAIREVVDGQQRLRTVLGFVDPKCLKDFDERRDRFVIKKVHNEKIADKPFEKLSEHYQSRVLEYEFSTHVLPIAVEDREVLEMFARLNATGVKLNEQELRNAEFYGEFKASMYQLAHQQLDRWRDWGVFTDDQISRMKEVEMTSDLVMSMMEGLKGKSQPRLKNLYGAYDDDFPSRREVERRFEHTMNEISKTLEQELKTTIFKSEVYFFSLFVFFYEKLYELGSSLERTKPKSLPSNLRDCLLAVSKRFHDQDVPSDVLDAVRRAATDLGRRRTRLDYMIAQC